MNTKKPNNSESEIKIKAMLLDIFIITTSKILKHYPAITAIAFFIFTILCAIFSNIYLSSFNINYFQFSSIYDIYQIPLSKGVLTQLAPTTLLIVLGIITITTPVFDNGDRNEPNKKITLLKKSINIKTILKTLKFLFLPISIIILILLSNSLFIDFPERAANEIKNGFSARYNIKTNKNEYECTSIIGATSSYLFTWNYSTNRPVIMPISMINEFDQVIADNPPLTNKRQKRPPTKQQAENLINKQLEWATTLNKICSQNVTWP